MPKGTLLVMRTDRLNEEIEQVVYDSRKSYEEVIFDKYFEALWRLSIAHQFICEKGLTPDFCEWQNEFDITERLEMEAIKKLDKEKKDDSTI